MDKSGCIFFSQCELEEIEKKITYKNSKKEGNGVYIIS